MAKVITFSRTFPAYHPKAGQHTFFVEKVLKSLGNGVEEHLLYKLALSSDIIHFGVPKHHTIRAGHRWKVGDYFSPRVWSGKPYNSKQIQFAPDIQIKKVWNFKIEENQFWIGQQALYSIYQYADVANNDGLEAQDFWDWFQFPKPFDGQVICWNEKIEY